MYLKAKHDMLANLTAGPVRKIVVPFFQFPNWHTLYMKLQRPNLDLTLNMFQNDVLMVLKWKPALPTDIEKDFFNFFRSSSEFTVYTLQPLLYHVSSHIILTNIQVRIATKGTGKVWNLPTPEKWEKLPFFTSILEISAKKDQQLIFYPPSQKRNSRSVNDSRTDEMAE